MGQKRLVILTRQVLCGGAYSVILERLMGAEQKKESIGSVMPDTGEGGALNIMETLVLTPSSFLPLLRWPQSPRVVSPRLVKMTIIRMFAL